MLLSAGPPLNTDSSSVCRRRPSLLYFQSILYLLSVYMDEHIVRLRRWDTTKCGCLNVCDYEGPQDEHVTEAKRIHITSSASFVFSVFRWEFSAPTCWDFNSFLRIVRVFVLTSTFLMTCSVSVVPSEDLDRPYKSHDFSWVCFFVRFCASCHRQVW